MTDRPDFAAWARETAKTFCEAPHGCSCSVCFAAVDHIAAALARVWDARGEVELEAARLRVESLWPCDPDNYPGLDDSQYGYVRHVALHMAKDAGRIAAGIEPIDHGRPWDGQALGRSTRNMLVNVLRMCSLLHLSPAELLADYEREIAAAIRAATTSGPGRHE